ncbi:MAG: hypothetical protein V1758_03770 [Pseudomonadota bacterium]
MDLLGLTGGDDIDFIIMTGSVDRRTGEDLFSHLRALFPSAKLLALVNRVTREMEIGLRSKGLVFFGSYRRFVQFHREIIGLNAKSGKRPGPQ